MTTIYLVQHDDVRPDALRSKNNPSTFTACRDAPRGNSGDHPVITDGWLGTTNDHCAHAHGEFDLDDADDRAKLAEAIEYRNIGTSINEITEWADGDDPAELELDVADTFTHTESCKYDLSSDDEWWPILNDGWESLDCYADGVYGNMSFSCGLTADEIERRLGDAEIGYDKIDVCDYDSATGQSAMICFHVRTADLRRAKATLATP